MSQESRIYTHPRHAKVDIPEIDLLTLLFDVEPAAAQDDTVLHVDAANPSNKITKAKVNSVQTLPYKVNLS